MKRVEAIVRPEKLGILLDALKELGYPGMTITEVKGHGVQRGVVQQWRGRQYTVEFLPKIKIELVVPDDKVASILTAIRENAMTGEVGDGKVFISTVDDAMRVRTGEMGEKAL